MYQHTNTNKTGLVKKRDVDNRSGQMVLRVDEHDYCDRIDEVILSTIQNNKCHIPMTGEIEVDAIIISDYDKGFLLEDDIKFICENNTNVFVDTKKRLGKWIVDCDYLKINDLEYEQNKDFFETPGNHHILKKTIITKGRNGCGYDPIFIPKNEKKTFGQMPFSKKYKMDHRSKAFKKLKNFFKRSVLD